MKEQLAVILLSIGVVLAEPPSAPYQPRGWRPNGPAFELPQKLDTQNNQQQSYLPPLEPRNPQMQYGVPDDDTITVQGLPVKEEMPIFMISPINGQQYVGPNFNADISNLIQRLKQSQFQSQQELFRKLEQELYETQNQQNVPNQPRQFGYQPAYPTNEPTTYTTTNEDSAETTTESIKNAPENKSEVKQKENILSVEITKEKLRELPIIFLGPIAQNGQLNQQFARFSLPQTSPNFGYNGPEHLAGLQSILSQRLVQQEAITKPEVVDDSLVEQITPTEQKPVVPQNAYNPVQPVLVQYQPQFQPGQIPRGIQIPQAFINQQQFLNPQDLNQQYPLNPQIHIQQFQQQNLQPFLNQQYDQQLLANSQQYQPLNQQFVPQYVDNQGQYYQNQVAQDQSPTALQSGLEVEQEGNDIEDKEEPEDINPTVIATATAFGTRTSPRVYAKYGVPASRPTPTDVQEPVTEAMDPTDEPEASEGPAIATANAFARGGRRKSAKLRARRLRPVFTLDKSGHLVLLNNNNNN